MLKQLILTTNVLLNSYKNQQHRIHCSQIVFLFIKDKEQSIVSPETIGSNDGIINTSSLSAWLSRAFHSQWRSGHLYWVVGPDRPKGFLLDPFIKHAHLTRRCHVVVSDFTPQLTSVSILNKWHCASAVRWSSFCIVNNLPSCICVTFFLPRILKSHPFHLFMMDRTIKTKIQICLKKFELTN